LAREGADPQHGRWPESDTPVPEAERRLYPGEGRVLLEARTESDKALDNQNDRF
jgi:hypothetical protein